MTSIKTKKTLIIISCVLLLICNWPGVKNISGLNDWYYRYSNYSGTYTSLEEPRVGYVITADLSNGKFHLNYDKNNPKGTKRIRLFIVSLR